MKNKKIPMHLLQSRFRLYGDSQTNVAYAVLDIAKSTMSRYMNAESPWPMEAIYTLKEEYDIPDEQVYAYFVEPYLRKQGILTN